MSPKCYYQPHLVRIIRPRWGECLICGKSRDTMIWVKDVGVVCPDHDAYAVVREYDDGYYVEETVVRILPSEGEARIECRELNRRVVEARLGTGFIPVSHKVEPLRSLIGRQERVVEVEEPEDDGW